MKDGDLASPLLDLDALLAPVDPDKPSGDDLRYDPVYDSLRELRREDDQTTPQGIWDYERKQSDWRNLRHQAIEVLTGRSKDLQVAAWLTEALLHQEGLPGLAAGLQLIGRLCRQYWQNAYPSLESDGELDARLAPFFWLDDRMPQSLTLIEMTAPQAGQSAAYRWQDWVTANRLEPLALTKAREFKAAIDKGDVSLSKFTAAVGLTPTPFFVARRDGLNACLAALDDLRQVLKELCGDDGPGLHKLENQLTEMLTAVNRFLSERGLVAPAEVQPTSGEPDEAAAEAGSREGPQQLVIRNRQEAYAFLDVIANYLLANEPHSPTAYLVKRAVNWGKMPLGELLTELVEEEKDRSKILKLLNLVQR
jgi:type VI secretion system ImpA family protein